MGVYRHGRGHSPPGSPVHRPDHEAQDGQAYKARNQGEGRYGQPRSEPVAPGESPRRGTFFAASLQVADSKFHFSSTRCPYLLVTSSTHFFASPGSSAPSRVAMG